MARSTRARWCVSFDVGDQTLLIVQLFEFTGSVNFSGQSSCLHFLSRLFELCSASIFLW